jgi:membrane-anchored protein YejM (alkaline phosphatase superfamily)
MPESQLPVESPNGAVILPQWAVRPLTVLAIVAGVLMPLVPDGLYQKICLAVVGVVAGLGVYSGGARK